MKAVLGFVLLALLVAPAVQAHANFQASHPGPAARLAVAPGEVWVAVTQDVDEAGSSLRVRDDQGRRVDNDDLQIDHHEGATLRVTLVANLTEGVYRVEWRALSRVDHHTTQEAFAFAVGNFTVSADDGSAENAPRPFAFVARTVFFAGFFLAAACLLFGWFVMPGGVPVFLSRAERWGWSSLVAASCLFVLDAGSRTGLGPSAWASSLVVRELLLRVAVASIGLVAVLGGRPRAAGRDAAVGLGLAIVAYLSARSGHASDAGWLVTGIDAVHLLATAAWVGGLALFAYLLFVGRRLGLAAGALRDIGLRFSRAALVCVLVMAITGVALAVTILGWADVGRPFAWFEGPYGAALLGKILLAALMVVVASINRFLFLARLGAAEGVAVGAERRRFGLFVGGEAGLGVVVLLLAAVLTSASPPYVPDASAYELEGEGDEFGVRMVAAAAPMPGTFSDLRFQITWRQDNSTLVDDSCGRPRGCILLEIVPPGAREADPDESDVHHGGEHRVLEPLGDGWWIVRDVLFAEPGGYGFLVEIQTEYVFLDVVELHADVTHAGHGG